MAKKQTDPTGKLASQHGNYKAELIKQNQALAQKINELKAIAAQLERQIIFNAGQIKLLNQMEKEKEKVVLD